MRTPTPKRENSILGSNKSPFTALLCILAISILGGLSAGCSGLVNAKSGGGGGDQTFSLSGQITPVAAGNGATVTLSGAASAATTADSSGKYSFSALAGGNYVVTPTHQGYSFSPASQSMTINGASQTLSNFVGSSQTYSISGNVSGVGDVTVTLGGAANATTTVDVAGNYTFSNIANGNYTVTPSKTGYSFTPTIKAVTVNNANITGVSFTASVQTQTYSISGTITGVGGATVTLSGAANATTTADGSGNFSFTGLGNGSYTVTPSETGYSFTPANKAVTISSANLTGVSFVATAVTYSISGTITGSSGATVTLSGAANATTTAGGSGNFSFTGLGNGSYTVTPSETGYSFTPANKAVTIGNANVTGVSFTAAAVTYSISGTITAGSGATVTLSGAGNATTTADGSGNFSFTGLGNGSYTVTPSETGYSFTPANKAVTISSANLTGVSFVATAVTYSISGTITGGTGATITLSGKSSATTTADGSGNFSFSSLVNGNYAITPSLTGYTFTPATQAVTINGANVAGISFTASVAAPTYAISGTISPASIGAGSVITLSGSGSGQTTAASNGNFSFGSLQNGTYTLTPSNSSDTFTPSSQSVTVNGGNVTGVDFTVQGQQGAGTPETVGAWYVLNEAADVHSGDQACYSPSQVNFSPNDTTITMIQGTFTCGFTGSSTGTGTTTQNYLSGSIMWHDLNFAPSSGHTIVIEVKAQLGRGWPAIWLLGGDKAANTGCQVSTPNTWDNVGTCNWPQDTMPNGDSAEIDIEEATEATGYVHMQGNVYANGQSNGVAQNVPGGADATQGFHVYHLDWSTTQECWGIDGTSNGCVTNTPVPKNPMVLIIENRVNPNGAPSSFPQVMTIQYVQVCDAGTGNTCTTPGVNGGNTLFFDNFTNE